MITVTPVSSMTRLTMLGQVTLIGWLVPLILAIAFLQGSLGHVSGIVLIPAAWQALVGGSMHGTLVLFGSAKAISSFTLAAGIAVAATSLMTGKAILAGYPLSPDAVDQLMRISIVLVIVALVSSTLACMVVRREIRSPSLG